jgi:ABC-type amino acid transport substrate-binding protein
MRGIFTSISIALVNASRPVAKLAVGNEVVTLPVRLAVDNADLTVFRAGDNIAAMTSQTATPQAGQLSRESHIFVRCLRALALAVLASSFVQAAVAAGPGEPLRFLGNASIPPMISLHDGKPEGIVVDLAHAIATKAGIAIDVEAMDWDEAQRLVGAAEQHGGAADGWTPPGLQKGGAREQER